MRLARLLGVLALAAGSLFVFGCTSARPIAPRVAAPPIAKRVAPREARPPAPELPSLADLSTRSVLVAPGMVAAGQRDATLDQAGGEVVRADARDLCVRVSFVASALVSARLEDARGELLASAPPATRGDLGPRGPVCIRRGNAVRIAFDGAQTSARPRVRWVGWSSR